MVAATCTSREPGLLATWPFPNDLSLSVFDIEHRKAGWWAIDTVNPNAWNTATSYLAISTADVALVQEAKVDDGYAREAAEQAARFNQWNVSLEPCLITKAGGKSAGAAVGSKSFIGMTTPAPVKESQHLHPKGRFCMRRVAAMTKGGVHCGSIHLFDGVGVTAKCNLDFLEGVGHTLSKLVGAWLIGGDWNCTPHDLAATGWLRKVGGDYQGTLGPHVQWQGV